MKKIFGMQVEVFLKNCEDVIVGIVFDIDDEFSYIQNDVNTVVAIPKENIKYYAYTSSNHETPIIQSEQEQALKVYVNKELVANIPVHPTFKLKEYSERIMKVALGNHEVQTALNGRVQKYAEYSPGKLYIETTHGENTNTSLPSSSFSMDNSAVMSNYLSPSEMATRLTNATKKSEK